MATWNGEPSQGTGGDTCNFPPPSGPAPDQAATRAGNKVLKSGPLFISSKGIGWTSWKKRWFILTRTSLVFFRADPNAVPQRGSDNLTLGGIDLNNSGSVVVKADKKLLTVLFPDGRDGRTFTLKAETLDDLYEWKNALETALTQAPSATLVTGQNGMLRNDQAEAMDGSAEQLKDKKSMVIGRPILLALEEVDGTPSFLEKALRFIEQHGVKVEGILRQAADVEHVEHRIREYEQGKVDFSPDEDAHVIADCIKYVIRELPSYPVPASCCNALLDVIRIDRERRVNAMRMAICETFPEPNRRLLQRILVMMQRVAAHKAVNRMSPSAVAACMAPLLLRPLLSGDCELEHDFDVGGDGSAQLLQAAAAANHAQGIVMTLLEEYDSIFGEGSLSQELYEETDESGSEGEEASDDEYYEDDDEEDEDEETDDEEDYEDDEEADDEEDEESGSETDENSGSLSSPSRNVDDGVSIHKKVVSGSTSGSQSPAAVHDLKDNHMPPSDKEKPQKTENTVRNHRSTDPLERHSKSAEALEITPRECSALHTSSHTIQKSTSIASGTISNARRPAMLGRTPAKKRSMESVGSIDIDMEKSEIENLEAEKADLVAKIAEEAKENKVLLANLENRKRAFYERRQALQNDVARLNEQLQKEKDLMEVGNQDPRKSGPCAATIGEKLKAYLDQLAAAEADMNSLRQKVDNIGKQLIRRGGNRESNNLTQPSKNDQGKVTGKQNETESTRTSQPDEKMTHSKGAAVDTSSPSKDKLQAPTPHQQHDSGKQTEAPTPPQQQHDSGKQTQPPLRQLVPVDSKKHRKLQLESVGSLKSRPSEELVNPEADSGRQAPTPPPQQLQHDSGKQTQPPLRQLVPVDSKKHRKLQLESVGSLKSRPSEELVNPEADSGRQAPTPPPQQLQHDSGKQTQPPLRQLVPVDSKKHRKLQLESVGSCKSRPSEELVNPEADSRKQTEAPTLQQHDSGKLTQPPLRQLVPVDSKKHRSLQLESVGSRKSRPSEELVNSEDDSGKQTEAPAPQQHDSGKQTEPPLRQLVPVDSKKHRSLQLESFGSRKSKPSDELVNCEADSGKQSQAPAPQQQQHDSVKQTQPPLRQLVPVDSKKHRSLQLESFGSLKSTSSGELVNSETDSGKQTEAPAPQQHDSGKQTQPPLRQLVPVDSKKHRKLQLESAGSRKF